MNVRTIQPHRLRRQTSAMTISHRDARVQAAPDTTVAVPLMDGLNAPLTVRERWDLTQVVSRVAWLLFMCLLTGE